MTTALERWALASNLRHKENLLLLLFVWFLCLQRVHNVVNTTWNDQSSSAAVWLCSSHYKVEHTYDKTRWHAYIRRHKVTHIPTDDEKMFIFLTDTRLPVLSPCVPRERALLSAPVTHTPPVCPAATRSTMENGAVWEMEAIYNCRIRTHTPRPNLRRIRRQSESPLSMLMSHNYLLTAQTNGVWGGEVTSNQNCHRWSSPVIERERRLAACHACAYGGAGGWGECVCVCDWKW